MSASDVPSALARVFQSKSGRPEDVGNLVRVIARSRPTWQIVARSEQLFATFEAIDSRTQALVCTFVSMLNRSDYCIDDCAGAALDAGVARGELLSLSHIPSHGLDPQTEALLRYSARVAIDPCGIPSSVAEEFLHQASAEQVLELTTMTSLKVFWNHLVSALQIPMEGRCSDSGLLDSLLAASHSEDWRVHKVGAWSNGD